jgi:hypothetical protein
LCCCCSTLSFFNKFLFYLTKPQGNPFLFVCFFDKRLLESESKQQQQQQLSSVKKKSYLPEKQARQRNFRAEGEASGPGS